MVKNSSRLFPVYLPMLFVVLLNGCALFVAEGASTALSGKSVSDHVVSFVSGKDCSFTRTESGKTYCVEDEVKYVQPTLYCYKTLANVSCYTTPDPGRSPDQIIRADGYSTMQ